MSDAITSLLVRVAAGVVLVAAVITTDPLTSITSVLTMVTALVVLVTAIVTARTRRDVKEVHVLVNSKMTDALNRIEQLTAALQRSDTEVPPEHYGVEDDWNKENE